MIERNQNGNQAVLKYHHGRKNDTTRCHVYLSNIYSLL